jgi:nitrogen regulatory protein P-II 2
MKYVIAIIQSHRLEEVREALAAHGVDSLIVVEARRYGTHEEHREFYRGAEYDVGFLPRTKIEFAVSSDLVDEAVATLREAAVTGEMGDGRIFVMSLDHSVQIRSGKVDMQVSSL